MSNQPTRRTTYKQRHAIKGARRQNFNPLTVRSIRNSLNSLKSNSGSNLSATSFEQVRAISTCRDRSNLLEAGLRPVRSQIPLRYLVRSWFETGRRQVRSWSQTCRRPASSCQFAASKVDDRPNFSSLQFYDQLRTSFEPDSVMEFRLGEQKAH